MASLVANYGSESESENEERSSSVDSTQKEENKNVNFFEAGDSNSNDSDVICEQSNEQDVNKGSNSDRLPNPLLDPLPSASCSLQNQPGASVFISQYHLAEQEKQSVLEKHVKLSETKISTGKKLQICHKFKRGRCRFGNNCKYSHDIDTCSKQQQAFDQVTDPRTRANSIPLYNDRVRTSLPQPEFTPAPKLEDKDDDSYMGNMKRKKRAGLSESLVPTKKALSSLAKQREKERPWTVSKRK